MLSSNLVVLLVKHARLTFVHLGHHLQDVRLVDLCLGPVAPHELEHRLRVNRLFLLLPLAQTNKRY